MFDPPFQNAVYWPEMHWLVDLCTLLGPSEDKLAMEYWSIATL